MNSPEETEEEEVNEFARPPDDYGFHPTGYAWASWYSDSEGLDAIHTTVQWKPARSRDHEPSHSIVRWTRRDGTGYQKDNSDDK